VTETAAQDETIRQVAEVDEAELETHTTGVAEHHRSS
jgi:hypothetical protein